MSANFFFFMKICFSSSRRFLFPIFDKEKSHRAEKISKPVDSAHLGQVGPITIRLTRGDSGQIFFTTLHFFFSFFFRRFLFFFSPHRKNCRKIIKISLEAEEVKKKNRRLVSVPRADFFLLPGEKRCAEFSFL